MSLPARATLALVLAAAFVCLPASAARKAAKKPAAKPAVSAASEAPTLLGTSKDWTAYQASTPEGKTCYALSSPKTTSPVIKGGRDQVYIIISTWPGRNVKDELQIVPGYQYKEGEPITALVGNRKTEFFAKNDAKSGSAWVKEVNDEAALVKSMRGGSKLVVTGTSKKGSTTTDTYSLSGIATALDRAHQACGN
ncbi:hypothetical protein FHS83_003728 [Rhizomicrobium palustre]|uniref:Invasion associated locus B family protein n=1 Tax=Rhizomicrobium palustre TaxID=189966 RepID=A0A846N5Z5_9PROT|nr:invasion associated locus B family protein [Rhizomicrobium palustre]NIK90410.1 hypothetical protein [Rhizomicrobium palustre]